MPKKLKFAKPNQLEAIGDVVTDNAVKAMYVKRMFDYTCELKINKRLECDADKALLNKIKCELFDDGVSVKDIVNKYFGHQVIEKLGDQKRAFTYYRDSSAIVNAHIHSIVPHTTASKVVGKTTFYMHEHVICKKSIKNINTRTYPNFVYEITRWNDTDFYVRCVLTHKTFLISLQQIQSSFTLPYANTVYSSQGASCAKPFVICDVFTKYASRNWFYTAITRAVRFEDIRFLKASLFDVERHLERLAEEIVKGYKYQDKNAGREWSDDYVDAAWILKSYRGSAEDVDITWCLKNITQIRLLCNARTTCCPTLKTIVNCFAKRAMWPSKISLMIKHGGYLQIVLGS